MKSKRIQLIVVFVIVALWGFLLCPDVFATEEEPAWRKPYNIAMLWVNFGILVVLFIKFAKKPLMKALNDIRLKISEDLKYFKSLLNSRTTDLNAEEGRIEDIQKHLDDIRKRIIEMGKKEKDKIIENANKAAQRMVEDARAYAKIQMDRARKELSDEMVDMAISMVEEKMKKEVSKEDNDKLISDFLVNLEATKPHLN